MQELKQIYNDQIKQKKIRDESEKKKDLQGYIDISNNMGQVSKNKQFQLS